MWGNDLNLILCKKKNHCVVRNLCPVLSVATVSALLLTDLEFLRCHRNPALLSLYQVPYRAVVPSTVPANRRHQHITAPNPSTEGFMSLSLNTLTSMSFLPFATPHESAIAQEGRQTLTSSWDSLLSSLASSPRVMFATYKCFYLHRSHLWRATTMEQQSKKPTTMCSYFKHQTFNEI